MSSYQPDIVPSSATGQALQAAIQKQLAHHGWSTEEDTVMAEYCLVMLGNRKTADQISTELSDLIGSDFEPSFVSWLFTELAHHYPDPSLSAAPETRTIGVVSDSRLSPINDDRRYPDRSAGAARGGRPGSVFGAAMSGVKRDARDMDVREREPPAQRARYERPQGSAFEGVPAGPRNPGMANGNMRRDGGRRGASIFDRVQGGGNAAGAGNMGYDAISGVIEAVQRGAHPSALAAIPFAALAQHPQAAFLNPQVLAQAQAHAMAQAQAFAAMQGQQIGWNNSRGGAAFKAQAPAFNPAFARGFGTGGEGFPTAPPRQQRQPYQPKVATPVALPSKPLEEDICKHGVDCSKPACPYSHPSPVATKESGLVLSSEACEKQLTCEDADCPKSHVSAAQKNPALVAAAASSAPPPRAVARPPPTVDPSAIPGAGEKPCKFAGSCTRAGCVFLHPWDVRGDASATGGVPCHWADKCTRADCHFSHPPSRPTPFAKGSKPKTSSSYTATFNKGSAAPSIGAWPAEKAAHVSDRLKRFNLKENEGEAERIIPGAAVVEGKKEDGDKVEIEVEEEKVAVLKTETTA